MSDLFRRLLGFSMVVGGCVFLVSPANAQWGYPTVSTYQSTYYPTPAPVYGTGIAPVAGAPLATAPTAPFPSRYSFHTPATDFSQAPIFPTTGNYPGVLPDASYHIPQTAYGYPEPYGSGIWTRPRGRIKYDVWSPYGKREVTYRFRRNGTVRVDVDD